MGENKTKIEEIAKAASDVQNLRNLHNRIEKSAPGDFHPSQLKLLGDLKNLTGQIEKRGEILGVSMPVVSRQAVLKPPIDTIPLTARQPKYTKISKAPVVHVPSLRAKKGSFFELKTFEAVVSYDPSATVVTPEPIPPSPIINQARISHSKSPNDTNTTLPIESPEIKALKERVKGCVEEILKQKANVDGTKVTTRKWGGGSKEYETYRNKLKENLDKLVLDLVTAAPDNPNKQLEILKDATKGNNNFGLLKKLCADLSSEKMSVKKGKVQVIPNLLKTVFSPEAEKPSPPPPKNRSSLYPKGSP